MAQEIELENTQRDGGIALERVIENQDDDEIDSWEKHDSYPVWKILLVVAGSAVAASWDP